MWTQNRSGRAASRNTIVFRAVLYLASAVVDSPDRGFQSECINITMQGCTVETVYRVQYISVTVNMDLG